MTNYYSKAVKLLVVLAPCLITGQVSAREDCFRSVTPNNPFEAIYRLVNPELQVDQQCENNKAIVEIYKSQDSEYKETLMRDLEFRKLAPFHQQSNTTRVTKESGVVQLMQIKISDDGATPVTNINTAKGFTTISGDK